MVPDLRRVIEYSRLVRITGGCRDNLLQGGIREFGTTYQFVEIVDISLMMLAVMETQSVG
jgi:hypothetical protein